MEKRGFVIAIVLVLAASMFASFINDREITGFYSSNQLKNSNERLKTIEENNKITIEDQYTGLVSSLSKPNGINIKNSNMITGKPIFSKTLISQPPIQPQPRFYKAVVPNTDSNDVSIINTIRNEEITKIPVGDKPWNVAMSGNGKYAYVALFEEGKIYKINMQNLFVSNVYNYPFTQASMNFVTDLEISPNDKWLIVSEMRGAKIHIFDTTTNNLIKTMTLCEICITDPTVALNSRVLIGFSSNNNDYAIFSNSYSRSGGLPYIHNVSIMHLPTQIIVKSGHTEFVTGNAAVDARLTKNENYYYATYNGGKGSLPKEFNLQTNPITYRTIAEELKENITYDHELIDGDSKVAFSNCAYTSPGTNNNLYIYDLNTENLLNIPSSEASIHLTYDPKKNEIWSICEPILWFCNPGKIDIFDVSTLSKITTIITPLGGGIPMPSFSQDKKYFYAVNSDLGQITVVDRSTYSIVKYIDVGSSPTGIFMQGDNSIKEGYG